MVKLLKIASPHCCLIVSSCCTYRKMYGTICASKHKKSFDCQIRIRILQDVIKSFNIYGIFEFNLDCNLFACLLASNNSSRELVSNILCRRRTFIRNDGVLSSSSIELYDHGDIHSPCFVLPIPTNRTIFNTRCHTLTTT